MKITVVNKYKHKPTENDFYIGRGSVLGNPFTSKELNKTKAKFQCSCREESITKHLEYLRNEVLNNNRLICDALNSIYLKALNEEVFLVCFCAPKSCHGDNIKQLILEKLI